MALVWTMSARHDGNGWNEGLELNCADYQLKSASMSHGPDGAVFRCMLGPVTEDVLAALERAAAARLEVRLVFANEPLRFVRIDLDRVEPGWIQFVGRIADTIPPDYDTSRPA